MKLDTENYIDFSLLSKFNRPFNFVTTVRGTGKTYGCKKLVLGRFKKYGEKTLWIRIFQDEVMSISKGRFFPTKMFEDEQIKKLGYDQSKFVYKGDGVMYDGEYIVYYSILSHAQSFKSHSDAPRITTIIFDEFMQEPKRMCMYRGDVIKDFNTFFSSFIREHPERMVRAWLLGNKESVSNPWFVKNNINIKPEWQGIRTIGMGYLICNINTPPKKLKETYNRYRDVLRLNGDEEYLEHGAINGLDRNHVTRIRKDGTERILWSFDFDGRKFRVYKFPVLKYYWVESGVSPKTPVIVDSPKGYPIEFNYKTMDKQLLLEIKMAWTMGLMRFNTLKAKEDYGILLKKLGWIG